MTGPDTDPRSRTAPPLASVVPARPNLRQVRAAGIIVAALALAGCVLGPVWAWWSPPGPLGERIRAGIIADETEAFIAADGRFAALTALVGLLAGVACWSVRSVRGPWVVAGLGLGGLGGAALTSLVGSAVRGSTPAVRVAPQVERIAHLPLQVHASGLLFVEGAAAVLGYGLFVAFTAADDLGHPDPARAAVAGPVPPGRAPGPVAERP